MRRPRPGTRRAARLPNTGGAAWRAENGVVLTVAFGMSVLVAAAGCFHDKGLGIEVDVGDTHASKVELYLGKVACNPQDNKAGIDCTSIAPPDGTVAPPTGTVAL